MKEKEFDKNIFEKSTTLEKDLSSFVLTVKKPRDRKVIISYLGWDGRGKKRLQAVADEFGITRERVRQIAKKFEGKFKRNERSNIADLPALERALSFIEGNTPALAFKVESKLAESKITKREFKVEGIMTAAEFMGREIPFRVVKVKKVDMKRIVISAEDVSHVKPIIRLARKDIKFRGAASVSDIAQRVYGESFSKDTKNFITVVLSSLNYFQWLDRKGEWFWFHTSSRNLMIKKIKKILSVAKRITISDIHDGIKKSSRVRGVVPPTDVLLELCRQNTWCSVEDDMVIADPKENFKRSLSGCERELIEIFEEHGSIMARSELKRICTDRGKGFLSTEQFLSDSPILKNYEPDVYGLIGADKLIRKA